MTKRGMEVAAAGQRIRSEKCGATERTGEQDQWRMASCPDPEVGLVWGLRAGEWRAGPGCRTRSGRIPRTSSPGMFFSHQIQGMYKMRGRHVLPLPRLSSATLSLFPGSRTRAVN